MRHEVIKHALRQWLLAALLLFAVSACGGGASGQAAQQQSKEHTLPNHNGPLPPGKGTPPKSSRLPSRSP